MDILLLTPDFPYPGQSGAALRNLGIIRGLSAAGHRLTLLSFCETGGRAEREALLRYCAAVHTAPLPRPGKLRRLSRLVTSRRADMAFRLESADYERALERLLAEREFDLVQFSGLELGGYLERVQERRRRAKVVYDALNAEADLQRVMAAVDWGQVSRWHAALYSTIQSGRLRRFESEVCRAVDGVIAVSDEDREQLREYGGAPIHVVPNGVEVADYLRRAGERSECQIVFSGKMDYRPNVDAVEWFCAAVWPRARARFPQARLVIVGRNPHPRIQTLAASGEIEITGRVESVAAHLHAATLFVAPLRMGSGTRLKILQAMACGCAVVSTSIGAAGLNEAARGAIVLADEAEDFARAICELMADGGRREALGARALAVARDHYDWSALMPRLLRAYEEQGLG